MCELGAIPKRTAIQKLKRSEFFRTDKEREQRRYLNKQGVEF